MSTGADCFFYEKTPGIWFYSIQRWPYGETEEYDDYGPFRSLEQAQDHLRRTQPNPGGYFTYPYKEGTTNE